MMILVFDVIVQFSPFIIWARYSGPSDKCAFLKRYRAVSKQAKRYNDKVKVDEVIDIRNGSI